MEAPGNDAEGNSSGKGLEVCMGMAVAPGHGPEDRAGNQAGGATGLDCCGGGGAGPHGHSSSVRVLGRARGVGVDPPECLCPPPPDPNPCCSPSLMSGLASLDPKTSSRLGVLTVAYYLWTTFVAVIVGIIMVSIIHPGGAAQKEMTEQSGKAIMSSADALLDLIR